MAIAKGKILTSYSWVILALFLVFLPLGQLLRMDIAFRNINFTLHIVDLIVLCSFPLYPFLNRDKSAKEILKFLTVLSFSYLISLFSFKNLPLVGFLYLVRLYAYLCFYMVVKNLCENRPSNSLKIIKLVNISLLLSLAFGWIQYFWFPDLTSLKYLGWDDHLYRLAGTFLDPGYTGLIFVFGFLTNIYLYNSEKKYSYLVLQIGFLLGILFTYSRASYLALFLGVVYLIIKTKLSRKLLYSFLIFFVVMTNFLPKLGSEGVRLERTNSIRLRFANYIETAQIFKSYPLWGVGFDNLCFFKNDKPSYLGVTSHSCFGSDSGILTVAATSGVVGIMYFGNLLTKIKRVMREQKNLLVNSLLIAVFAHSFFSIVCFITLYLDCL
jgi:hypothetical protein